MITRFIRFQLDHCNGNTYGRKEKGRKVLRAIALSLVTVDERKKTCFALGSNADLFCSTIKWLSICRQICLQSKHTAALHSHIFQLLHSLLSSKWHFRHAIWMKTEINITEASQSVVEGSLRRVAIKAVRRLMKP